MQLTIAKNSKDLQQALLKLAEGKQRVALVPTMGALHAGHATLIEEAKRHADAVIVSVFVNPKQFGPSEDFKQYPRMLEEDSKKAAAAGASVVYAPAMEDMYPPGFATHISVGELGSILCGKSRPGHFDGVATVVAKLLMRILPHVVVFGEKDYQQLCVVHQLIRDLDMEIELVAVPTVRETDGLAMSSRNAYLSPSERKVAPKLHATLVQVAARLAAGGPAANALAGGVEALTSAGFKVDYLDLRTSGSLQLLEKLETPARLLAAAWLGKTRLIDNIAME